MNTFLPYPDFAKSAACLDRARLGKQRVEVLQLLKALSVPGAGWANHPATKMWRGHVGSLCLYGLAICAEWQKRGYKDTCADKITTFAADRHICFESPLWLGDEEFHRSHRSNLTRKAPEHYSQYWSEPSDLPYIWPATTLAKGV